MEENEIIEGNKLIAEFMQIPNCDRCKDCGKFKFGVGLFFSPSEMKYHSSFDWLMPVVEKIEDIGYIFMIGKNEAGITCSRSSGLSRPNISVKMNSKQESVYNSCVYFIKWYNSQTPPK